MSSLPVVHPQAMSGLPLVSEEPLSTHPPICLFLWQQKGGVALGPPVQLPVGGLTGSRGLSRQLDSGFFLKGE